MSTIRVEVLFTQDCPNADAARAAVERAARAVRVPIAITSTLVSGEAEARHLRFPGSPTVRVAGRDVEPGAEAIEQFSLG
jgi:hypothetical protein